MLKGKIINLVRIHCNNKKSIDKIIESIGSSETSFDFNKIISLNEKTELEMLKKWEQPLNCNVENLIIDKDEISIFFRTISKPPIKILKQLSLNSNIDDIVLNYANIDMKSSGGLYYIMRGGIIDSVLFPENSDENYEFTSKMLKLFEQGDNNLLKEKLDII
jgi:hypothetical protein